MPLEYQCCFCALDIEVGDESAVLISFRNLWGGEQSQDMYSHSRCVTNWLGSSLSSAVPFDVEAFRD